MNKKKLDKYYRVLGVPYGTGKDRIKKAYKEIVLIWHPDRFGNDPALQAKAQKTLREINNAYSNILNSLEDDTENYSSQIFPNFIKHINVFRTVLVVLFLVTGILLYVHIDSYDKQENFFTLGSSREKVISIQGEPDRVSGNVLYYGPSGVFLKNGSVVGWDSSPLVPLKAKLVTGAHPGSNMIAIDSTKEEVAAIAGTPTKLDDNVWEYGRSVIFFSNDKVTGWVVSPLNPIKVKD